MAVVKVLVVDGYGPGGERPLVDALDSHLRAIGHTPIVCGLAAAGFDDFMSDTERAAYLTEQPLVSDATRTGADAVRSVGGLVVCYPIVHGTAPPRVKSWQERVFVLGVGFEFLPSGRITGALHHLDRALVVGVPGPRSGAGRHDHRNDFGPCLARSFHLSSNRRCRARYLELADADPEPALALLDRW